VATLATLLGDVDDEAPAMARLVEIPVCYGGDFGPDLDALADHARLGAEEVVERHAGAMYTVAMLGFAPGFPYLFGLDPALHMPRRASPRTRVPAGSVAIGGAQTGIYPSELPGGWQLIGRTPLVLFDADRDPPSLLMPGDRVRFVAIDAAALAVRRAPA
jgi:KipI family sensor histidine kinase inhibitor